MKELTPSLLGIVGSGKWGGSGMGRGRERGRRGEGARGKGRVRGGNHKKRRTSLFPGAEEQGRKRGGGGELQEKDQTVQT